MKVISGDDTGLLKVVSVEESRIVCTYGTQNRDFAIDRLCWSSHGGDSQVAAASRNGVVRVWDVDGDAAPTADGDNPTAGVEVAALGAPVRGLHVFRASATRRMVTCTDKGDVQLRVLDTPTPPNGAAHGTGAAGVVSTMNVGGPVSQMRVAEASEDGAEWGTDAALIGVGGKEKELSVWNLHTQQRVFLAKNVSDDAVGLRVPVWITDLAFVPQDSHKIAVVTGHYQVRLYDTRTQRRPVVNVTIGEHAFTSVLVSPDAKYLVTGDGAGNESQIDLGTGRVLGKYQGMVGGALTALSQHPRVSVVASASLDRFLRVHHTNTRTLISKVYMKQRLGPILVSSELPLPSQHMVDPVGHYRFDFWEESAKDEYEATVAELKATQPTKPATKKPWHAARDADDEDDVEEEDEENDADESDEDPYEQIFGSSERTSSAAARTRNPGGTSKADSNPRRSVPATGKPSRLMGKKQGDPKGTANKKMKKRKLNAAS